MEMKNDTPKQPTIREEIEKIVKYPYLCCGDLTGKCNCKEKNDKVKVSAILALFSSHLQKEREEMEKIINQPHTDDEGNAFYDDIEIAHFRQQLKESYKKLLTTL
jgi:hypothetical protein